jgi:alpha-L-rhamnosidase
MKSAGIWWIVGIVIGSALPSSLAEAGPLEVGELKTEYHRDPLGLDALSPRLSWILTSTQKNVTQAAYQVVARGPAGVLWDTGKVASPQSIHVSYGGPALKSLDRVRWTVSVWDQAGNKAISNPASFEMGLLSEADWDGALWIGGEPPAPEGPLPVDEKAMAWIWYPDAGDLSTVAPAGTRGFRRSFVVNAVSEIARAHLVCAGDGTAAIWINRHAVGHCSGSHSLGTIEIKDALRDGLNEISAVSSNLTAAAGFVGQILIEKSDGSVSRTGTDASWEACKLGEQTQSIPATCPWVAAKVVAAIGAGKSWTPFNSKARAPTMGLPPTVLRREWNLSTSPKRARISATALGIYEIRINGKRVGEEYFAPGWTDYAKRVQVQTYDITPLLRKGRNAIVATLADGWYAGKLGWAANAEDPWAIYPLRFRARLFIEGDNSASIVTDSSWKASTGPVRLASLYNGEKYDARDEQIGIDRPGFDDSDWQPANAKALNHRLVATPGAAVRVTQELKPKSMTTPRPAVYVFDMGQNLVGWVRMTVRGPAGTQVTLRFAEMLNPDGTIYTENLRTAKATDAYTLSGRGVETWEPRFTFHGFRYVEITGFPGKPTKDTLLGRVAHSDIPSTLSFSTSSKLLNQLQSNIDWGQRGNFVSVPTDCPQRDERLGWMGDANIFVQTACMNRDVAAFFTKWIRDVNDGQNKGSYRDVAPSVPALRDIGAPAWGDAGVNVPMALYECYADRQLLEESFPHMEGWIDYILRNNPDLLWKNARGNDFGDWLSIGDESDKEVLGTAFFARSTDQVARAAAILGREIEVKKYTALAGRIRQAFVKAYVDSETGAIRSGTQTLYALALRFGLLPEKLAAKAGQQLIANIERHGTHLSTGFVGVSHLLPALSQVGRDDVAFSLLNQTSYPSWLYSVTQGATTIWERWNGWTRHDGFADPSMNSFNHYSFGSVGAWMYGNIAGLQPLAAGWKRIGVQPKPQGGIDHASAAMKTPYGKLVSTWSVKRGVFVLNVEIPVNTTADVSVPGQSSRGNDAVFQVGSGKWTFSSRLPSGEAAAVQSKH